MKSKKGFFIGKYVVGVIIAAMCLGLLGYLGYTILNSFELSRESGKAEDSMREILERIELLEAGGNGIKTYTLSFPLGWSLIGWPNDGSFQLKQNNFVGGNPNPRNFPYEDSMPKECVENRWEKCICFCKHDFFDLYDSCNEFSLCEDFSRFDEISLNEDGSNENQFIQIDNSRDLEISLNDNKLRIIAIV